MEWRKFSVVIFIIMALVNPALAQEEEDAVDFAPIDLNEIEPIDDELFDEPLKEPVDDALGGDQPRKNQGSKLSEPRPVNMSLTSQRRFGVEARLLFPEVLGLGGGWRLNESWQIGVEGARFQVPFFLANVGIQSWGVYGQWYPYQGTFYIGSGLGQQSLNLDIGDTIILYKVGLESKVTTQYARAYVGWQWFMDSGFSFGFRLGLQAPLDSTSEFALNAPGASPDSIDDIKNDDRYRELEDGIDTAADILGRAWVPLFSLLHIGWYF